MSIKLNEVKWNFKVSKIWSAMIRAQKGGWAKNQGVGIWPVNEAMYNTSDDWNQGK